MTTTEDSLQPTYEQLVEANQILRQQLAHAEREAETVKGCFCDLQERLFDEVSRVIVYYEQEVKKRYGVTLEPQRTRWTRSDRIQE